MTADYGRRRSDAIVDDVARQIVSRWTTERLDVPLEHATCAVRLDRDGRRLITPDHADTLGPRLRHLFRSLDGYLDQPETEPLDTGWSIPSDETVSVGQLPVDLAMEARAAGLTVVRRWDVMESIDDAVVVLMFARDHESLTTPFVGRMDDAIDLLAATLQQRADERRLRAATELDPLTSLGNRRGFDRTMQTVRAGCNDAVGCVFLDIDHFKQINDSWGHGVGDAILAEVARRITLVCREADVVARIGGDEFAVLLCDTTPTDLEQIARRLVEVIAQPLHEIGPVRVTASVGVSFGPPDSALDVADAALYESKRAGRNRAIMAPAAR